MNIEKQTYLKAFEDITRDRKLYTAVELLKSWSENVRRHNLADAACTYMTHIMIPELQGEFVGNKRLQPWVYEELFEDDNDCPTTLEEWVAAFPGSAIVSFNDKIRGQNAHKHGRTIPDPQKAKETRTGLFLTANAVSGDNHLDAEVTKLRFFFIDFDGGNKPDIMARIENLPNKPSIVVETAHGYHVYFRLRDHQRSSAEWSGVEKRMIKEEGGDPQSSNPARVLRMPFTWNCKEEPFLVRIVKWNNAKYEFDDIAKWYPEPKRMEYKQVPQFQNVSVKEAPIGVLSADHRHDGLMEWCKKAYWRIRENVALASEVRRSALEWYEHGHTPQKPNWRKEVNDLCDFFERRQWGSPQR